MKLASLKGDRAFQRLRKGRPGHAQYLSTRWLPSNEGVVQVGIVVNKKVGKAVVRNRVRRRIKEALRHLLAEHSLHDKALHAKVPSFRLVIIARPEAATASYSELKRALKKALGKGQVFA